jgi:hypothetical protein
MMIKRLLAILFVLIFCTMPRISVGQLYISPNGNDHNAGTQLHPKATLAAALRAIRELRRLHDTSVYNGSHIIVKGGLYPLYEPVFIRPEDAGTPSSPAIIEAAPG